MGKAADPRPLRLTPGRRCDKLEAEARNWGEGGGEHGTLSQTRAGAAPFSGGGIRAGAALQHLHRGADRLHAGKATGKLRELELIRDERDLDKFCRDYGVKKEDIKRIY